MSLRVMDKCYECGSAKLLIKREDYIYSECGAPNIVLKDVEVTRCANCHDLTVTIFAMHYLHHCIARALWRKRTLTESEKNFLSKIEHPFERKTWEYRRRGQLIECFMPNPAHETGESLNTSRDATAK